MTEGVQPEAHWSQWAIGIGVWLLVLSVITLGATSCEAARIDAKDLCAGIGQGCITSTGTVKDVESSEVTVLYDDDSWPVTLAGSDAPAIGARVRLEWWEGHLVALHDVTTDRRYRTRDWPTPWSPVILLFFVPGIAALTLGGLVQLARRG